MAEYTLTDFDKYKVEQGASLGTKIDDKIVLSTCINIYPLGTNRYMGYVIFNNNLYQLFYFDSDGNLYNLNKTKVGVAYIVDSNITKTTGTKLVRETSSDGTSNARQFPKYGIATASETGGTEESGKEEEIFSIATLQPREEVSASCLQAMLQKYENPLNIDNTKIKQLVSKSFLFAQEFINQAVLYREKETTSATVENNKYASVDSDSLSSDTDKLLYYYWLVNRVECPILVDEVEAGCQLPILTIVVGWRVGKPFEYYFLSCCHVLEFKFGRMIS